MGRGKLDSLLVINEGTFLLPEKFSVKTYLRVYRFQNKGSNPLIKIKDLVRLVFQLFLNFLFSFISIQCIHIYMITMIYNSKIVFMTCHDQTTKSSFPECKQKWESIF